MTSRNAFIWGLCLAAGACLAQGPQPAGVIRGMIVDVNGQPVEGVYVTAYPADAPFRGAGAQAWTDSAGRFSIRTTRWARYRLFTSKEDDGYADSTMGIHSQIEVPVVEVTALAPIATVTVHLGPKAAVISGSVTDATTGKLIPSPTLHLWRWTDGVDRTSEFVHDTATNDGHYRFLVPPNKEVGLAFSAPGYQTWTYCGDSGGDTPFPLNLPPEAKKTIDVKLQPLPK